MENMNISEVSDWLKEKGFSDEVLREFEGTYGVFFFLIA